MLKFKKNHYTIEEVTLCGETVRFRAFRDLVYVEKPVNVEFQKMNLFVPESYYEGTSINGYDLLSAPVFMPNTVGGYMPGPADEPGANPFLQGKPNTIFRALQHGYVVASPAIRGRVQKGEDGHYNGKAPACVVDYKAAVRYLHFLADELPGDENKIITNGTSAGGALSSLMGSTGNHPDYEPYLQALGAADAGDDVFAASCYCPIINLEHADMAYEWEFCSVNDFHRANMKMDEGGRPVFTPVDGEMTEEQIRVSVEEKALFPAYVSSLGLKDEEVRYRDHDKEELSFYSKATTDVEFLFPFGWGELWGIADRTDYDLTQHQNVSGQDLTYFDDEANEKYIPYVIEPSLGADRMVLAFLCSAYDEEVLDAEKNDVRTVLHFHPALAPVKIGVLPLSKKLNEGALKVFEGLAKQYNCEFDDRGNIGKRYRRQDEIGTPFCVTYDFESENDGAVTVRDRDTMEQERIKIEDLKAYFEKKFEF